MLSKEQIITVLLELPEKLKAAELSMLEAGWLRVEVERKLTLRKAKIAQEVAEEVDENGKKRYSNQEARESALELRLSQDEEYRKLLEEWKEAMRKEELAKCELNHQKSRLKVAELLTNLIKEE